MKTFKPRYDILPEAQMGLWKELAFAAKSGFTLYGGTAIALRVGHRESVDFDFFSARPLDKRFIMKETSLLDNGEVIQDDRNTLTLSVNRGGGTVTVSFFGDLVPKRIAGRVSVPEMTSDGVIQAASLHDLFATKVKVMLDRAEAKDY